jgi:hypothetical protein
MMSGWKIMDWDDDGGCSRCFEVSISRRNIYRIHFPSSLVTCQHLRWNLEMLEEATNEKCSCRILSPSLISYNHAGWFKAKEIQVAVEIGATFSREEPTDELSLETGPF